MDIGNWGLATISHFHIIDACGAQHGDNMTRTTTIDSLSPLQCQLIVLIGLLRGSLPWYALREILRASCVAARPDDAALDAAYRELEANGILRSIPRNGFNLVRVDEPLRGSLVRQRAASAFGPIDYPATLALMRQLCPELLKVTDAGGKPRAVDAVLATVRMALPRPMSRYLAMGPRSCVG